MAKVCKVICARNVRPLSRMLTKYLRSGANTPFVEEMLEGGEERDEDEEDRDGKEEEEEEEEEEEDEGEEEEGEDHEGEQEEKDSTRKKSKYQYITITDSESEEGIPAGSADEDDEDEDGAEEEEEEEEDDSVIGDISHKSSYEQGLDVRSKGKEIGNMWNSTATSVLHDNKNKDGPSAMQQSEQQSTEGEGRKKTKENVVGVRKMEWFKEKKKSRAAVSGVTEGSLLGKSYKEKMLPHVKVNLKNQVVMSTSGQSSSSSSSSSSSIPTSTLSAASVVSSSSSLSSISHRPLLHDLTPNQGQLGPQHQQQTPQSLSKLFSNISTLSAVSSTAEAGVAVSDMVKPRKRISTSEGQGVQERKRKRKRKSKESVSIVATTSVRSRKVRGLSYVDKHGSDESDNDEKKALTTTGRRNRSTNTQRGGRRNGRKGTGRGEGEKRQGGRGKGKKGIFCSRKTALAECLNVADSVPEGVDVSF